MTTTTALAAPPSIDAATIERVLIHGDLKQLSAAQKIVYYQQVCESLGLNPLTQPFAYLLLNGKEVLYAKRDAAEQLRATRKISLEIKAREILEDCYVVTACARTPDGRLDESTGAVSIGGLKGEARANAMMKAETKAKRRVTLSICGLGLLDETEVDTIPGASTTPAYIVDAPAPKQLDAPGPSEKPEIRAAVSGEARGHSDLTPLSDLAARAAQLANPQPSYVLYIQRFEARTGKIKGVAVLSSGEELAIFDERLATLAAECCQMGSAVVVEVKTPPSGRPYLKALRRVESVVDGPAFEEPPPLTDSDVPF